MNLIKKLVLAVLLTCAFSFSTVLAQNDTMYVMKSGVVVGKYNINTQIDSLIFYQPNISPGDTFTDIRDGNVYHIVNIGTQKWMGENLRYLPSVVGPATGSQTEPYYYVSGYDGTDVNEAKATANYTTYGVLYNWTAAMDSAGSSSANPSGVQGACPAGWHLPSFDEWVQLTDYLGDEYVAGGKLKEAGTTHWMSPNTGATNETGFTALPGGSRKITGIFVEVTRYNYLWSATEWSSDKSWFRAMQFDLSSIYIGTYDKGIGFSCRCVKD